jgi:hypothetical protein
MSYKAFIETSGVVGVLEVGKWSCFGMYLLLETFTIVSFLHPIFKIVISEKHMRSTQGLTWIKLDVMGIYKSSWAEDLCVEANKFWFYSLCLSLFLGIVQLWELSDVLPATTSEGKEKEDAEKVKRERKKCEAKRGIFMKKLVIDGCDLFIPGIATGWIVVSTANVGMASVVSTVLALVDIWERIQNTP